jgi:zinc/manganese transport system substrate-binding protein
MRRRYAIPRALAVLSALYLATGSASGDRLRVLAATTDVGAFADAAGGELVEIDVVARPDRDPHALEIRPSAMRRAARADVYISVGLSLDIWSEGVVAGSRNRDLVVIDCSEAIVPLDVPTGRVDARMGDVHPDGNPHYWVDPRNAVLVTTMLAVRFAALDPANTERYRARASDFAGEVEQRMSGWTAVLANALFVEYHTSWRYLAERFGVRIAGSVEPLPGIPPSARHLAALVETIRRERVPLVVREPYHAKDPVAMLSRDTGVREVTLTVSCPEPNADGYAARDGVEP